MTLSNYAVVAMWEQAQSLTHPQLAKTLLRAARPELSEDNVLDLTIGERDAELLLIFKNNFQRQLELLERCDACGTELEFDLTVDELLQQNKTKVTKTLTVETEHGELQIRLPTTRDLLAIKQTNGNTKKKLIERCIQSISDNKMSVVEQPIMSLIEEKMQRADPLADMRIALRCHACGHCFETVFDIVAILWNAWKVRAQNLLNEVHILALNYHWDERTILEMSDMRRQFYLSKFGA